MKNKFVLVFILAAVGGAVITACAIRRNNTKKMLAQVADGGYETAPDILFPDREVSSKLHYGPVIPN